MSLKYFFVVPIWAMNNVHYYFLYSNQEPSICPRERIQNQSPNNAKLKKIPKSKTKLVQNLDDENTWHVDITKLSVIPFLVQFTYYVVSILATFSCLTLICDRPWGQVICSTYDLQRYWKILVPIDIKSTPFYSAFRFVQMMQNNVSCFCFHCDWKYNVCRYKKWSCLIAMSSKSSFLSSSSSSLEPSYLCDPH